MNPRVKDARPNPDYTVTLLFENGETRVFDVSLILTRGSFANSRI